MKKTRPCFTAGGNTRTELNHRVASPSIPSSLSLYQLPLYFVYPPLCVLLSLLSLTLRYYADPRLIISDGIDNDIIMYSVTVASVGSSVQENFSSPGIFFLIATRKAPVYSIRFA